MKELEFRTTAKTREDMIKRLEAAITMFKDNYLDATVFEDDEEEGQYPECKECEELREAVEDLQRAIATLICYGLPIPTDLADMYNDVRDRFLDYECVHEDEEEDDD